MMFKISRFFLYAAVFCVVLVTTGTLFPFIVGKYVFFRTCVDLSLALFLIGLVMDADAGVYLARLKRIFRSPLTWAISAYVAIFLIAGFSGLRPAFSFWSNFERGEGGLQMLTLYTYFVLLVTLFRGEREWRRLFWCSVAAAVLVIGYGAAAGMKYTDADWATVGQAGATAQALKGTGGPWFQLFHNFIGPQLGERFQGSIGNPAYVAAYLLFIFFYLAILFLRSSAWRSTGRAVLYGALTLLFALVFYFSGTRGAFLGLLSGIAAGAFVFGISERRFRKWAIGGAVAIVLAASLLIGFRGTSFVSHLPGARIFDISLKNVVSSGAEGTFSTRTIMWGIAWRGFLHRPLLGYGPENFIWVFDRYFDPHYFVPAQGFGAWFDRAHSIVFDNLAETGILGLLSFFSIFAALAAFLRSPKGAEDPAAPWRAAAEKALFTAIAAAYLVQGLILFDVLATYMNLFIFFAFALATFVPLPQAAENSDRPGTARYGVAVAGGVLALLAIYFGALLPYAKASRYIAAEASAGMIADEAEFEEHFNYVLRFSSPVGGEEVPKYLSSDISGLLSRLSDPKTEPVARAIVNYIEPYLWKNDVRHLLVAAQMRYVLWHNFHKAQDFEAAKNDFEAAHGIGPELPQPLYGLYQIYSEAKDTPHISEVKQEILQLWPDAFAPSAAH
jgi:O-antigen ligase